MRLLIKAITISFLASTLGFTGYDAAFARRYDSCPRGGDETEVHKNCRILR